MTPTGRGRINVHGFLVPLLAATLTACGSTPPAPPTEQTLRPIVEERCIVPSMSVVEMGTPANLRFGHERVITVDRLDIGAGMRSRLSDDAAPVDAWPVTVNFHLAYKPLAGGLVSTESAPGQRLEFDRSLACWFYRRPDGSWRATIVTPKDARPVTTRIWQSIRGVFQ